MRGDECVGQWLASSASASASSLRGVGGERRVGFLRGTAVRGGTTVYDGGGELRTSGVGRFGLCHRKIASTSACVYASTSSRKGVGGGRRVGCRKGSAVCSGVTI